MFWSPKSNYCTVVKIVNMIPGYGTSDKHQHQYNPIQKLVHKLEKYP